LNIVERKQGVGPYLGCYLVLVNDDWCCILLDEPLLLYLVMLEEELIHLLVTGLEHLVIFLHHVVKGRLDDVALVEVGSIEVGAFFLHA
jgi:hypothetical protein